MRGMSTITGKAISGVAHLRQSVVDILTTPIGTRVMRRDYGSRLFELIDAPLNQATLVQLYAAVAGALDRWEPRIVVQRINAESIEPGHVTIDIDALHVPDGVELSITGIVV